MILLYVSNNLVLPIYFKTIKNKVWYSMCMYPADYFILINFILFALSPVDP